MRILAYMTKRAHQAMWDNMLSIVHALEEMGHMVVPCDVSDMEACELTLELLTQSNIFDMSIAFNSLGLEWRQKDNSSVYLYENLEMPHVSIMLDEPFNRFVSGYDYPCKNHIVTYIVCVQ